MEVKPGYKQTEVGVIPEDWNVRALGDLASISSGGTPSRQVPDYWGGPIPWVTTTEIDFNTIDRTEESISRNGLTNSAAKILPPGTILIALYGQGKTRGKVAMLGISASTNQACAAIVLMTAVSKLFTFHFLTSRYQIIRGMSNSGSQDNLSGQIIKSIQIPLPPTLAEQEAIAEALSDADALIESLEQLIAKKRHIKQGAMQELLTGKRRLPGFKGEWETKRLDELGTWQGGMTPSMRNASYWQGGTVPWVSSGDVKSVRLTSTAYSITTYAIKQNTTTLLPPGSIILVTRSGILRKYLPVAMNMKEMAINQDIKSIIPHGSIYPDFLLHSLIGNGDLILSRCLKSGTTVESIEFPWLKAFTIGVPSLPEQTAIATILSDMDAEIESLEAKLSKARHIKQGMMQELLTGRIRLV